MAVADGKKVVDTGCCFHTDNMFVKVVDPAACETGKNE